MYRRVGRVGVDVGVGVGVVECGLYEANGQIILTKSCVAVRTAHVENIIRRIGVGSVISCVCKFVCLCVSVHVERLFVVAMETNSLLPTIQAASRLYHAAVSNVVTRMLRGNCSSGI